RMRERGVDLLTLQQTLAAANMGLPAGSVIEQGGGATRMLTVETGNLIASIDEVADLVVGVSNARPVYLREVARIEYGARTPSQYVWFTPGAAAG
ncbi:MAG: efflux RND transporter permease subunit, partial [Rhodoferax sp.]|nr:efflux RND transporter permease subunit [Rhodoferax sp.]